MENRKMQYVAANRQLSPRELGMLRRDDVAYVKPVVVDGVEAFSVHAADGAQMAIFASRDLAFAAIRQTDLDPASVH